MKDIPGEALGAFLRDVRQHKVLSREDETELFARWKLTGDRRIADQLIAANLRLVLVVANRYRGKRHDVLDLVQEGSIGLLHALSKFDPARGNRFTSYASYWIRAYIFKFILSNHHLVKIGTTQAQRTLFFNLKKTREKLERDGATATAEQIARELDIDVEEVMEMEMRLAASAASIDAPMQDESDEHAPRRREFAATDAGRPDVLVEARDFGVFAHARVRAFGATLDGRMKEIFDRRLIAEEPMKLAELAKKFGVTRERVRQIEEDLKDRLRRYVKRAA